MSRLQDVVDKFAADWLALQDEKPSQDTVISGAFCAQTGQPFCLCLKLATGLGAMIDFTGLTCLESGKPVTAESYEWMNEARTERAAAAQGGVSP
jgi:hypothetical protein